MMMSLTRVSTIISMTRIIQPTSPDGQAGEYEIFDDDDRGDLLELSIARYVWFVVGLLRGCRVQDLAQHCQVSIGDVDSPMS